MFIPALLLLFVILCFSRGKSLFLTWYLFVQNYEQNRLTQIKNQKIDFSFISAHCVTSTKMGAILGWGCLHILSWKKPYMCALGHTSCTL